MGEEETWLRPHAQSLRSSKTLKHIKLRNSENLGDFIKELKFDFTSKYK